MAGVEPTSQKLQDVYHQYGYGLLQRENTQIDSQRFVIKCPRLASIVEKWDQLPANLKLAIVAIASST